MDIINTIGPVNIVLIGGILFLGILIGMTKLLKKLGLSGLKLFGIFGILLVATSIIVGASISGFVTSGTSKEKANGLTEKINENNKLIETLQSYINKLATSSSNQELIENLRRTIEDLKEENEDLEEEIKGLEDDIEDLYSIIDNFEVSS